MTDEAEIDATLTGSPSELAFRALCAILDTSASYNDQLLARCDAALDRWPDELRKAPWAWLCALAEGHKKPTWSLVRSLETTVLGEVHEVHLPTLAETGMLTRTTMLHPDGSNLDAVLTDVERWPHLVDLRIGHVHDEATTYQLLSGSPLLRQLHRLDLFSSSPNQRVPGTPFRIPGGDPVPLRYAALRAPDLSALLHDGVVPHLSRAAVLITDVDEAAELGRCAGLDQLEGLSLTFSCGGVSFSGDKSRRNYPRAGDDAAAIAFFADARLPRLRSLTVRGMRAMWTRHGVGPEGMHTVIRSGLLSQLQSLRLEHLPLGDDATAAIVRQVPTSDLTRLELVDVGAGPATAETIAASGAFPRLRVLDLNSNELPEGAAATMASGSSLASLEVLDLSGDGGQPYYTESFVQAVTDADLRAWVGTSSVRRLRAIALRSTRLTGAGVRTLMRADGLGALRRLDLSHNAQLDGWPDGVQEAPVWDALEELDLSDCGIGDDDIERLTRIQSAPALRNLSLRYNSIGSAGLGLLAAWPAAHELWRLDLHDNIVEDDGVVALATASLLYKLTDLDLDQDIWNYEARDLDDRAAESVAASSAFPRLEQFTAGVIDEYHGCRYSTGPSPAGLHAIVSSPHLRPEVAAALRALPVNPFSHDDDVPPVRFPMPEGDPGSTDRRRSQDFRSGGPEPA